MASLAGKTLFITGASRGIGLAIAKRAARDGARIAIAAKTAEPHPKLPGTIFSAADEIEAAGGRALPLVTDIRMDDQVRAAVDKTVEVFGGIDILVNNASAIDTSPTLELPMKRFDLMHQINTRGTFAVSQACLPHLLAAANPHVLTIAPPLEVSAPWFARHLAYTMAKYGMTLVAHGLAEEFRERGLASNTLWPKTIIATAAIWNRWGRERAQHARKPEIMADAAHAILVRPARQCTHNFFIDEDVLRAEGVTDFAGYAVDAKRELASDIFLD